MSLAEQNLRIVEAYRESGNPWPATAVDMARWAISNRLWDISPARLVRQCADQLAEAMRQEYVTDPQGRRVRVKHVAPYTEQGHFSFKWDDMRTAEHRHMELSFAHRRDEIVSDCRQLKTDIDSYNDNFLPRGERSIQGVFDFTNDMLEMELEAEANSLVPT